MPIAIKSLSGAVLFSSNRASLREALVEAVLQRADLQGADLQGADLQGADLRGADLQGADLQRADLQGADLQRADLQGADLRGQWIIQGQTRSDGYAFFLQRLKDDTEPMIKAGCHHFTIARAEAHWTKTRGGTKLFDETRAIVRAMVDTMHIRGLK